MQLTVADEIVAVAVGFCLLQPTADGLIHSFTRSLTQLRLQLPKSQTLYAGKQTIRGTRSHTHTHLQNVTHTQSYTC